MSHVTRTSSSVSSSSSRTRQLTPRPRGRNGATGPHQTVRPVRRDPLGVTSLPEVPETVRMLSEATATTATRARMHTTSTTSTMITTTAAYVGQSQVRRYIATHVQMLWCVSFRSVARVDRKSVCSPHESKARSCVATAIGEVTRSSSAAQGFIFTGAAGAYSAATITAATSANTRSRCKSTLTTTHRHARARAGHVST